MRFNPSGQPNMAKWSSVLRFLYGRRRLILKHVGLSGLHGKNSMLDGRVVEACGMILFGWRKIMRWNAKPQPNDGDTRIRSKFLLFPKVIKGEWRWLELASYKQKYAWYWDGGIWFTKEWVD